ncbi:hypothetical protein A2V82_15910 [candidate division KSB1 bacterium RBG_16_48_16]|nr:MAG: hypothetical protein A2V82_15910 [candidate division KSB1 bacterium RBG_16_48_16]
MKKISAILLFCATVLSAASPGTTGFQFLRSQVGARPTGMAGAFVSVSNDVNSLYYNPAGITTFTERTGNFTYLNHLLDFNSGFIGAVVPKLGPGNAGFAIYYMDYGNFTKTDVNGENMGEFGANSIAISGSYAYEFYKNLYAGASAKYIRAAIDNYAADALAVDLGVQYYIPAQELTVAASVNNLGKAISAFVAEKDDLPMSIRFGLSKKLAHLPLLLGFNVYKFKNENWYGALGGEFMLSENLSLRLGYDTVGKDMDTDLGSSKDRLAGAAIGLGIRVKDIDIDYSFSSFGEIGALNRFSLSSQF